MCRTWVGADGLVNSDSREGGPGEWQVGGTIVLLGLQLWGFWHTRLQTNIRGGTVSGEERQKSTRCTANRHLQITTIAFCAHRTQFNKAVKRIWKHLKPEFKSCWQKSKNNSNWNLFKSSRVSNKSSLNSVGVNKSETSLTRHHQ